MTSARMRAALRRTRRGILPASRRTRVPPTESATTAVRVVARNVSAAVAAVIDAAPEATSERPVKTRKATAGRSRPLRTDRVDRAVRDNDTEVPIPATAIARITAATRTADARAARARWPSDVRLRRRASKSRAC